MAIIVDISNQLLCVAEVTNEPLPAVWDDTLIWDDNDTWEDTPDAI